MPFEDDGFEVIGDVVDEATIDSIINELDPASREVTGAGVRNAEKKFNSIKALASCPAILSMASGYLSGTPQLVRAILFVKSNEKNWLVTWHQDKTVSVSSKFEEIGWGPWSEKDGVLHVQPPLDVLNQIVTFRIHLDDMSKENGCLKVLPKSHKLGVISQEQISGYTKGTVPYYCLARRGSALVMRPHILHASSKSTSEFARRVLHLEYSSYQLPGGIHWA